MNSLEDVYNWIANAGTYYGTLGGTDIPSPAGPKAGPGVKAASGPDNPADAVRQQYQAAANSIGNGPALSPGQLAGQYFSPGGTSRSVIVWAIVAVLFVVGVWGLVAPGGGVAIIERARK